VSLRAFAIFDVVAVVPVLPRGIGTSFLEDRREVEKAKIRRERNKREWTDYKCSTRVSLDVGGMLPRARTATKLQSSHGT